MAETFYGDAAGFTAYWAARGVELPGTADTATIEAALLVASNWLDQSFISSFQGLKVGGRDQLLEWPRDGVQDIYGYYVSASVPPREVVNATYEAGYRQLITPGIFFKDYTPSKYKSVSISQAIAVEYAIGDAYAFQTQMPQIAAILYPIIGAMTAGAMSSLSGGTTRV